MKIFHWLTQLACTSSRNEKESILESIKDSEDENLFVSVARSAYDGRLNYYVKDIDMPLVHSGDMTLEEAIDELHEKIASRLVTGNAARDFLTNLMEHLDEEDSSVFYMILMRDLRCGVSARTINKVFGDKNIYEHPYMRCSSFNEKNLKKISFPCYSQTKMDGLYLDVAVDHDWCVHVQTRSGQYLPNVLKPETIRALCEFTSLEGKVLSGEALYTDVNGKLYDRKTSNGILNSDDIDPSRVRFFVWDVFDYDSWDVGKNYKDETSYKERFENLQSIVKELDSEQILLVDTVVCHSVQDVIDHFRDNRLKGEEGTVIKDFSGIWKSGDNPLQIKVKVVFDCDVRLTGYKEGNGKYVGKIGSLLYESEDGFIKGSVGSGLSDSDRDMPLSKLQRLIDARQVMTIKGNDLVQDKTDDTVWSVFLPRFVEFRQDKTEADSYKKIFEQVKSFTNALQLIKG